MTPDDVRKRVAMIQDTAGDDESAHSAEALKTQALDFARWCA